MGKLANSYANLMPLMNTPFEPGHCKETAENMPAGARRDIALAEYAYFSGAPETAMIGVEPYLLSENIEARLSASFIFAYACLSLGQIARAREALDALNTVIVATAEDEAPAQAASAFVSYASAVLLHLPLPKDLPNTEDFLPLLPFGVRAFALYVQAHALYLQEEYARSAGMVEAALAMGAEQYPIPAIYLHLVAVMDYMSLRQAGRAEAHLLAAWEMARPDDLIEGFGEHHGLLGGMLEAVIKPQWPQDFKRIIAITYRFSAGWRKIHNPATGHDVADDLTTTEFAIAMLAARGWTNAEIAQHLRISVNTVKVHIAEAMRRLNVGSRKDLKEYMLR